MQTVMMNIAWQAVDSSALENAKELEENLTGNGNFLGAIILCIGFWVFSSLVLHLIIPKALEKIHRDKHPFVYLLIRGFRKPLALYLKIIGVCWGLLIVASWRPEEATGLVYRILDGLPVFLYKLMRITAIVSIAWGLLSSNEITMLLWRNAKNKLDVNTSKSVTRFVSAIFNVLIVAIAAVIILSEFNYDINGLIAGLGLGGLTIALAAKDSAANFFGGLVLVIEKPFEIGDWIACDGVEGTVEDINLRSTSIRTGPGALTVVPNAKVADSAITNWSGGMEKRRADFMLELTYDATKEQLDRYLKEVREMLENNDEVVTESVLVRMSEFTGSGVGIKLMFYTTVPGLADHLRVRERINFELLRITEECGVAFAYPSQSVYLQEAEEVMSGPKKKKITDDADHNPNPMDKA